MKFRKPRDSALPDSKEIVMQGFEDRGAEFGVEQEPELLTLGEPAALSAGDGFRWITGGFEAVTRDLMGWVLIALIVLAFNIGLQLIPYIGNLVVAILSPVLAGGIYLGLRDSEQGALLHPGTVFSGFSNRWGRLMSIGGISLFALWGIGGAVAFFILGSMVTDLFTSGEALGAQLAGFLQGDGTAFMSLMLKVFGGIVIAMICFVPIYALTLFAPVLIVMHDIDVVTACKMSFVACVRNVLPLSLWGLLMSFISMVGLIPCGLGVLLTIPLYFTSQYIGYKRIFLEAP